MGEMLVILEYGVAGWFLAGFIFACLGGFRVIREAEAAATPKTASYWLSLFVLYPVILARAAMIAAFEIMRGGAR